MEFLNPYLADAFAGLTLLVLVLFGLVFTLNSRLSQVRRMIRTLLTGPQGEDLETLLRRCLAESGSALARCDELQLRDDALAEQLRGCLQHQGLVRFDAYGDVSGNQSFSLAMLNDRRDGTIITSLFGRHDGRCYGKAVVNGEAEFALSEEESQALQEALRSTGVKTQEGRRRFTRS